MSELQSHGPYFALKRGNGSIVHPDSPEVYIFAKGISPYVRDTARRDGLTAVPVMIQEIPEEDPVCQRAMEASLERARLADQPKEPVWWREIVALVVMVGGLTLSIYHHEAVWAAICGLYLGVITRGAQAHLERKAAALRASQTVDER